MVELSKETVTSVVNLDIGPRSVLMETAPMAAKLTPTTLLDATNRMVKSLTTFVNRGNSNHGDQPHLLLVRL